MLKLELHFKLKGKYFVAIYIKSFFMKLTKKFGSGLCYGPASVAQHVAHPLGLDARPNPRHS